MKKRILAIVLALLVVLSMSVVAFASTTTKCPKCGATISGSDETECAHNLADHVADCPYVQCPYCEKYFASETTLTAHEAACSSNPANQSTLTYECTYKDSDGNVCGKVFDSYDNYAAHVAAEHTTDSLACPYCKYQATSKEDYNNHLTANHADQTGAKTTLWDTIQRQFDKYVMGYGENTADNSFTSIVRVFAYMVEVVMSVFTDSGAAGVFTDAGESGVAYFFETLVPQMFENLGNLFA